MIIHDTDITTAISLEYLCNFLKRKKKTTHNIKNQTDENYFLSNSIKMTIKFFLAETTGNFWGLTSVDRLPVVTKGVPYLFFPVNINYCVLLLRT